MRVSPDIRREAGSVGIEEIETLPEKIRGIRKIKLNRLIGSVTVEYDPDVFEKRLWDDLIAGENLDEILPIIHQLQKEVM